MKISTLNLIDIIMYQMCEEKIRNYKITVIQGNNTQSIPSFLLKTYQILENPKYNDVVCWTQNGEGFVVKKVKQFAQNILPTHFRHSNYTSFVRQLNMYDFHKTRQQNQENAFKNSMFKKGQKHLLREIQRKDYKKKKQKSQNTQKLDPIVNEIEIKNNIKKIQHEKQFYQKGVHLLTKINQQMNEKQNQLGNFDQNYPKLNDQSITQILQIIFKVKSLNNGWYTRLASLGKQWQNMLTSRKNALKKQIEIERVQQNNKNDLGPTMPSIKSFIPHC